MKCQNCKKHKANMEKPWVGDGGMIGFVHGAYSYWCDCCMLQAQMKHAEEVIKNYEKLKKELYKSKCK